jgi:AcrR family transcriptional regulator
MTTVSDDRADSERAVEPGLEPGLRERKKLQTRDAIHEAAFRLIDEQGLEATTIDQICQAADVSSRTFFNYFPSKSAALLQFSETLISDDTRERFLAARGGLVWALCDVIGSNSDRRPDHLQMKKLVVRHPELMTTVSTMMLERRTQLVALAAERASSQRQAELAVSLVMAAFASTMHEQDTDVSLVTRLRRITEEMRGTLDEQLN